jgi:hypothetical protein
LGLNDVFDKEGTTKKGKREQKRRKLWVRAIVDAVFGAGIQCRFIQEEEKSLRWCVCLYRGSLQERKVSISITVNKWRGEVSNIDFDFLTWIWILNSFDSVLFKISLLYILCHPVTFCLSGLLFI